MHLKALHRDWVMNTSGRSFCTRGVRECGMQRAQYLCSPDPCTPKHNTGLGDKAHQGTASAPGGTDSEGLAGLLQSPPTATHAALLHAAWGAALCGSSARPISTAPPTCVAVPAHLQQLKVKRVQALPLGQRLTHLQEPRNC